MEWILLGVGLVIGFSVGMMAGLAHLAWQITRHL